MALPLDPGDTIAAVASPSGAALRGIVRLSGPAALSIAVESFAEQSNECKPLARASVRSGSLRVDGLRPPLPVMIALWPAPRTYTGQNIAEIHLVGSIPLVSLVLAHCLGRGARLAEAGEFTLRAFLNGRIDLTRAEAVLGVIDARNSVQLESALKQLAGGLSTPILALRDRLLDVLAQLEANLDFTEEPDVDPLGRGALADELAHAASEVESLAGRMSERDRTEGYRRVVLVGPPNVGKSRLFNALVKRDQAIVSPMAGTTRDYLTGLVDCDGMAILLVDTAGVETAENCLTAKAQSAGELQRANADLILNCRSLELDCSAELHNRAAEIPRLDVWTQSDRGLPALGPENPLTMVITSAATGIGLDTLRSAIASRIREESHGGDLPAGTSARCRGSLVGARSSLLSAAGTLLNGGGDELVALDLHQAIDDLGSVVGAVVTDDILDRIFRRFCIGK